MSSLFPEVGSKAPPSLAISVRDSYDEETGREVRSLLAEISKNHKNAKRLCRLSAKARLMSSLPWVTRPALSWFSEYFNLLDKDLANQSSAQLCISAWVASKLLEISDTPNWFCPTDALTHMLLATDLRGAVIGDLQLPYGAFYIEVPAGVMYIYDPTTYWHEVSAIAVTRGEITEDTLNKAREMGDPTADQVPLGPRILIETFAEPNENSTSPWDDAWGFRSYRIGDPAQSLDSVCGASVGPLELKKGRPTCRIGNKELFAAESRSALLRFVFNLCIYMSSEAASVQHIHEAEIKRLRGDKKWKSLRKTVQDRIKRLQDDRVFAVGSDVVIDPELREAVRSGGLAGNKLSYRVLVRGHWRNQACGQGRKARKQLWIKPHVRGTELPTPVVGHNYEVR